MERISLDQLIKNAEKRRVSRKEYIGKTLDDMLHANMDIFIRIDVHGKKREAVFENIDRVLEIFGMTYQNDLLFKDISYQASIYLKSDFPWMREAAYQAAEQLQIALISVINLGSDAIKVWSKPSSTSCICQTSRPLLEKWLAMSKTTDMIQAEILQDFLNLSLQDFLEYCRRDDQLTEIYYVADWSMEMEEDGSMKYQATLRDLLRIGAEFSVEKKAWIPQKLSLEQKEVLADVFFLCFRNLIPEDYVSPCLPPYL